MSEKQSSQERQLALIEFLVEKELTGATNKEVAIGMKVSAVVACRDVAVLANRGWVERKPDGRWRLSPKFARFTSRMARAFDDLRLKLKEDEDRYFGQEGRRII